MQSLSKSDLGKFSHYYYHIFAMARRTKETLAYINRKFTFPSQKILICVLDIVRLLAICLASYLFSFDLSCFKKGSVSFLKIFLLNYSIKWVWMEADCKLVQFCKFYIFIGVSPRQVWLFLKSSVPIGSRTYLT